MVKPAPISPESRLPAAPPPEAATGGAPAGTPAAAEASPPKAPAAPPARDPAPALPKAAETAPAAVVEPVAKPAATAPAEAKTAVTKAAFKAPVPEIPAPEIAAPKTPAPKPPVSKAARAVRPGRKARLAPARLRTEKPAAKQAAPVPPVTKPSPVSKPSPASKPVPVSKPVRKPASESVSSTARTAAAAPAGIEKAKAAPSLGATALPRPPEFAAITSAAVMTQALAMAKAFGELQARMLDHACAELKARLGEAETLARTDSAADAVVLQARAVRRSYDAYAEHLKQLARIAGKAAGKGRD
ncbi:hypothetical protein ASE63_01870 [Bosea sp. Root381]|uniref:hypothetical protein n=1 Tax=Bosea sp. Root381 TaxID=1736524 RepID=UPI0007124263|nr:hypothetical protein [Bosea sp. Root381]KRE17962.1 hypothetical protein ASE63_01870 [Bosea sp. Root381]